jgi:F420-dependent methylenetetrahydromethanopterin dehydrogenase
MTTVAYSAAILDMQAALAETSTELERVMDDILPQPRMENSNIISLDGHAQHSHAL